MIVIAPYPNGFHPDIIAVVALYRPGGEGAFDIWRLGAGGDLQHLAEPSVVRQYDKVEGHYNDVSGWCKENLTGPYIINKETDILFDGVRVRVGRESDMAYFQLRWG